MRIHTDLITEGLIREAAAVAEVKIERLNHHGSKSRDHAFDVILSGSGVYGGQYGSLDCKNATWDEWGMFLGHLYRLDSGVLAGPYKGNVEDNYDSFDFLTGGRYTWLTPAQQHRRHRWDWHCVQGTYCFTPGAPESFTEFGCDCGAVRRHIISYVSAQEVAA